jgi:hypothetical protein
MWKNHFRNKTDESATGGIVIWSPGSRAVVQNSGTTRYVLFSVEADGRVNWDGARLRLNEMVAPEEFQVNGALQVTGKLSTSNGATNKYPLCFLHESECNVGLVRWAEGQSEYIFSSKTRQCDNPIAITRIQIGLVITTTITRLQDDECGHATFRITVLDKNGGVQSMKAGDFTSYWFL